MLLSICRLSACLSPAQIYQRVGDLAVALDGAEVSRRLQYKIPQSIAISISIIIILYYAKRQHMTDTKSNTIQNTKVKTYTNTQKL